MAELGGIKPRCQRLNVVGRAKQGVMCGGGQWCGKGVCGPSKPWGVRSVAGVCVQVQQRVCVLGGARNGVRCVWGMCAEGGNAVRGGGATWEWEPRVWHVVHKGAGKNVGGVEPRQQPASRCLARENPVCRQQVRAVQIKGNIRNRKIT